MITRSDQYYMCNKYSYQYNECEKRLTRTISVMNNLTSTMSLINDKLMMNCLDIIELVRNQQIKTNRSKAVSVDQDLNQQIQS